MYISDEQAVASAIAALTSVWLICLIPSLALLILGIVAKWKLYEKAAEPGWAAIIPFYGDYVLYKLTWGNGWFFLLMFVPFANLVIYIITMIKLSQAFGKDGGWACGLIFLTLIFMCIMAFSKDIQYTGVPGQANAYAPGGYGTASGGCTANGCQQQQGFQNPYSQVNQQNTQQACQQSAQNSQYYYQQTSAPNTPKFCPYCGTALDGDPKFCHICGKQL